MPQNRWRYSLKPAFPHRSGADLTADPVVIKLADTASDLEEVFGFNIYEIQNDDQTIFGIARATIPTGFTLQPVPDGSLVVAYFGTSEEQFGETYEPAACCLFLVAQSIRGCLLVRTPRVCCCSPPTGGPTRWWVECFGKRHEVWDECGEPTITCRYLTRRRPPARPRTRGTLEAFQPRIAFGS